MRINSIQLASFQSFVDSGVIPLGTLTVLVGKNNSGKSAVLNAVRQIQEALSLPAPNVVRVGSTSALVSLQVSDIPTYARVNQSAANGRLDVQIQRTGGFSIQYAFPEQTAATAGFNQFGSSLQNAVILPLLAERTSRLFDENVNQQLAATVRFDVSNIAALLSRVVSGPDERASTFRDACMKLFGLNIVLIPSQNGQVPGAVVGDDQTISIAAMGTGVVSLVRMVALLVLARDKIILIEEPENDLHPAALKSLLTLVIKASTQNQVLLTTHSHIVLNALGAEGAEILRVAQSIEQGVPTSQISVIKTPIERLELLEELGYELGDFGLYDGILILEESSAQSVVERLIGWFTPRLLGRIRVIAANGVNDVKPRFSDLRRMFTFVDRQAAYIDRAWVVVDGDDAGIRVVDELKKAFSSSSNYFMTLDRPDFELYFPEPFVERAITVTTEADSNRRRNLKHDLIVDLHQWINEDEGRARDAFGVSAARVIEVLRMIDEALT